MTLEEAKIEAQKLINKHCDALGSYTNKIVYDSAVRTAKIDIQNTIDLLNLLNFQCIQSVYMKKIIVDNIYNYNLVKDVLGKLS